MCLANFTARPLRVDEIERRQFTAFQLAVIILVPLENLPGLKPTICRSAAHSILVGPSPLLLLRPRTRDGGRLATTRHRLIASRVIRGSVARSVAMTTSLAAPYVLDPSPRNHLANYLRFP